MIVLTLAALIQASPETPPEEPNRAELCSAHMNVFIAETMREVGRVAGPSWFIRDWWEERRPEPDGAGALTEAQRKVLEDALPARRTADAAAFDAERKSCIDEAIDAGAVPGMGGPA